MEQKKLLVRLDSSKLDGVELDHYDPFPDEMVMEGVSEHQSFTFDHGELYVGTYQAEPAKLLLKDYPNDEFMYVLSGKIIITEEGGVAEEFGPGQGLVLKKGFCGTFEMQDNLRKIAIMNGEKYSH